MSEVTAPKALCCAQGIGGWVASLVEPFLAIKSSRLDYQRIRFPPANRVAQPRWIRVFGQGTAIQKDPEECAKESLLGERLRSRLYRKLAGFEADGHIPEVFRVLWIRAPDSG